MQKRAMSKALKELSSSGARIAQIKSILPLLVLLTQVGDSQGLSLAAPVVAVAYDEWFAQCLATLLVAMTTWFIVAWATPFVCRSFKWCFARVFQRRTAQEEPETETEAQVRSVGTQANLGMSRAEQRFQDEYVDRCQELREVLQERCREVELCEEELRRLNIENRELRERVERFRLRREPQRIAVATSRGQRFHLPE